MEIEALNDLSAKRRLIRPLLSPTSPADALASYYALWHDPRRTQLTLHYGANERVDGFLAICQTGLDLFRPLVTLRASGEDAVAELVRAALKPGRLYQTVVPVLLAPALRAQLQMDQTTVSRTYILDASRFQPIINVLVQRVSSADAAPRFQIESRGELVAISGTNWRSPQFAEVFVYVHPSGRGRGWGKSVVSACTASLIEDGLRPLYLAEEGSEVSIRLAEGLGYVDSGERESIGVGQRKL